MKHKILTPPRHPPPGVIRKVLSFIKYAFIFFIFFCIILFFFIFFELSVNLRSEPKKKKNIRISLIRNHGALN